jgi:enolase
LAAVEEEAEQSVAQVRRLFLVLFPHLVAGVDHTLIEADLREKVDRLALAILAVMVAVMSEAAAAAEVKPVTV